jgi:ATP-dependent Lhr-like helicase
MVLERFHPSVAAWFENTFSVPTEPQARGWPSIQSGTHTLIAAPTGSGKTLAAFLAAIDSLVRQSQAGHLPDETQVVYVSPLKALSNDIQRNLQQPLDGIRQQLERDGHRAADLRVLVRTGDTPASERQAMTRRPPHLVVTTPESLYILLTSEGGRRMLRTVHTVIVDEIHALVRDKRGSHLALTLERLEALAQRRLVRIGLSATQRPIEQVAQFLVGRRDTACTVIDTGHRRVLDLGLEVPQSPLEAVMSGEVWEEIYTRLATLIGEHRTTLVFVNTRRMAERLARHLSERIGKEHVTSHHGSLSREHRLQAEERLKTGQLRALVATASLELGIDIGDVDLVCQLGSTRSIAAFLQRVGRSGHGVGRVPKGRLFPLSRDELVECTALLDAVHRGELDRVEIPQAPLDILAQQVVACVASEEWTEDELFALVQRAHPYRDLPRAQFDQIVRMLADGYATHRGRRSAYLHHDVVNHRLRARRGARLAAITSGGAIPDNADYRVVQDPGETFVGTVNEDFAIESIPGDIFQLGNTSWLIRRVEPGRVRVEDARGQPPTIPFWLGEAPGRTAELSSAVSRLRADLAAELEADGGGVDSVVDWARSAYGAEESAATQLVEYLAAGRAALGVMPTQDTIVLERFFDEAGGMQLVVHSTFGSRLNRAWGLALRKRFCRKFNFELQAAATEDAIVLSLGPTHSFPLQDVARYLDAASVRDVLVQALLAAPMFEVRWRWNCSRALAVPRFNGGRKVAPQLARMQAADLLTVVFPDQVACAENLSGDREVPDHPLVQQTIGDCLHEAMDIERLEALLRRIATGDIAIVARDLREPSPLALEILNARPYAFLDDAPLEERRTQAVLNRRWLDPQAAQDIGALDADAIARVRDEIRPDPRNADELHDALVLQAFLTESEASEWRTHFEALRADGRALELRVGERAPLWIAVERVQQWQAVHPAATCTPALDVPAALARDWTREQALVEMLRGRLEGTGPVTVPAVAEQMHVEARALEAAMLALESEGFVLRGRFTPGVEVEEWCERRLLARIHRYTLHRLRSEIEPVSAADFIAFLLEWQCVAPESRVRGAQALAAVLEQLEGVGVAAAAWERDVIPARVEGYDPAWLDQLCASGKFTWARVSAPRSGSAPVRTTPIALLRRANVETWRKLHGAPHADDVELSADARTVHDAIAARGALFFEDIVSASRLLRTQVERALAELVACGLVSSDGFTGLRALLVPADRRRPIAAGGRRRRTTAAYGVEDAGRWGSLARPVAEPTLGFPPDIADATEFIARVLLRRWGVVFRAVLEREVGLPPWRDLLRTLRRLEARGEIRGGRFVSGFSGEQFALPEAVGPLRKQRRTRADQAAVSVSGADPLNLVGILTPGPRIPAHPDNRVLFRNGEPVAVQASGEVHWLGNEPADPWPLRQALAGRPMSPQLRAYLRRAG